jgi:hypothetical protein
MLPVLPEGDLIIAMNRSAELLLGPLRHSGFAPSGSSALR